MTPETPIDDAPDWYKDAVIYELHVRAFSDSDGDGIGDFRGPDRRSSTTCRTSASRRSGCCRSTRRRCATTATTSPTTRDVHPDYGTLRDFERFLREAHRRGLRVITELVLNHTSDQHPWFQRARRAPPGSRWRDFYVWSDTPDALPRRAHHLQGLRDLELDVGPGRRAPTTGTASTRHQPDLNFDNPRGPARRCSRVVDFWLEMGVDGLRLDAVPYLYEREGTNCENLPETHAFLQASCARTSTSSFPDRMLLAEANQWPEDAVAYFGDGDECHMAFHFPLMPRLFMAIQHGGPLPDRRHPRSRRRRSPTTASGRIFLRNHDELTLEMVTDEERDYMYRVYAADPQARINLGIRRRLAPLLGNDRRRDRADERPAASRCRARRSSTTATRSAWATTSTSATATACARRCSGAPTATPASRAPTRSGSTCRSIIDPEYHYEAVNVEAQEQQPRLAAVVDEAADRAAQALRGVRPRRRSSSSTPRTARVLAFVRSDERRDASWSSPTSRASRSTSSSTSRASAARCRSSCSARRDFPPIGELPYLLTLGPHAFYWFGASRAAEQRADEPTTVGSPVDRGQRLDRRARHGPRDAPSSSARSPASCRRGAGSRARRARSAASRSSTRCRSPARAARSAPAC